MTSSWRSVRQQNYLPVHRSYNHPITATTLKDTPISELLHVYEDHLKIDLLSSWFMSKDAFYGIFLSPAGFSPVRTQLVSPFLTGQRWDQSIMLTFQGFMQATNTLPTPWNIVDVEHKRAKTTFRLTLAPINQSEDDSPPRMVGFWASVRSILIQRDRLGSDSSDTGVHSPSDTDERNQFKLISLWPKLKRKGYPISLLYEKWFLLNSP